MRVCYFIRIALTQMHDELDQENIALTELINFKRHSTDELDQEKNVLTLLINLDKRKALTQLMNLTRKEWC